MCFLAICMSSLEKCLFRSSTYFLIRFVFLILSCMMCLYILEINPLSIASFTNIFSQSEGFLFFFLCFPLLCRNFYVQLNIIYLFLFLFSSIYEVDHKRFCINLCQSILCRFSSKNFIVSDLTFSSVTHFEFTFCIWYQIVF